MASQAIQPVINATNQPFVRPFTMEPMNADSMALKALAAGVSSHPDERESMGNPPKGSVASLHGKDILVSWLLGQE
jgi:hypothetical protein